MASRAQVTPQEIAFIRRRRVFMFLLTSLIATFVAGLTGVFSIYWVTLPGLLNLGFVVAASNIASREQMLLRTKPQAPTKISQPTVVIPAKKVSLEEPIVKISDEAPRTWKPVATPLPAYVTAQRAASFTRAIESDRPWTSQEMLEHAAKLQSERAERIKQAQQRLEEARALAMEKARRAALAASQVEQNVAKNRAVGE